jgi:hypothetical protein
MKPTYQEYFNTVIKRAKNDLKNPRVTFNWGYHDCEQENKNNWDIRDMSNHFDPYYAMGYNARLEEINKGIEYKNDSSHAWKVYINGLSQDDLLIVRNSILESLIIGREYLFTKKTRRDQFSVSNWNDIHSQLISYLNR